MRRVARLLQHAAVEGEPDSSRLKKRCGRRPGPGLPRSCARARCRSSPPCASARADRRQLVQPRPVAMAKLCRVRLDRPRHCRMAALDPVGTMQRTRPGGICSPRCSEQLSISRPVSASSGSPMRDQRAADSRCADRAARVHAAALVGDHHQRTIAFLRRVPGVEQLVLRPGARHRRSAVRRTCGRRGDASRLRPDLRGPVNKVAITGQVPQCSRCCTARRVAVADDEAFPTRVGGQPIWQRDLFHLRLGPLSRGLGATGTALGGGPACGQGGSVPGPVRGQRRPGAHAVLRRARHPNVRRTMLTAPAATHAAPSATAPDRRDR